MQKIVIFYEKINKNRIIVDFSTKNMIQMYAIIQVMSEFHDEMKKACQYVAMK